jgi:hypothetical protein
VFWVISVYFNIRNTLPKSGTFLLGHPLYIKGRVHNRTGHERPEGKKKYRSILSSASALDGMGGRRHIPAALPLGKRPGTHHTGVWVGPRAVTDGRGKSRPHWDSIHGPLSSQRVAIPKYAHTHARARAPIIIEPGTRHESYPDVK